MPPRNITIYADDVGMHKDCQIDGKAEFFESSNTCPRTRVADREGETRVSRTLSERASNALRNESEERQTSCCLINSAQYWFLLVS